MDEINQEDELIAHFVGVASIPASEARQYLLANNWDLPSALTEFYTAQEEGETGQEHEENLAGYEEEEEEDDDDEEVPLRSARPSGGHRLGDGPSNPQPIPTSASSGPSQPKKKAAPQKKFATLGDFSSDSHAHGDEDDDDHDPKQDMFAGGEKSGLAVQNPDDIKKKILEKAMKGGKSAPKDEAKPLSSHFTGSARTLGGDDAPSEIIEQPSMPQVPQRGEHVERILHFWNNGFSVDDGDLYRSDDQRNAEILNGIRQGRAPLSIMNVSPGQEVDVEIKQHQEDYVRPKKKYVPFGGSGNRLGSPTPGAGSTSMPGAFTSDPAPTPAATSATSVASAPAVLDIDDSQPVINLQIRLGSGTRLPARFNASHTIGDVYSFVAAASPESRSREWVLQTTFPSTELTDKAKILGEISDFKRGGVVVQKWK